jgi:hypothetical protein
VPRLHGSACHDEPLRIPERPLHLDGTKPHKAADRSSSFSHERELADRTTGSRHPEAQTGDLPPIVSPAGRAASSSSKPSH